MTTEWQKGGRRREIAEIYNRGLFDANTGNHDGLRYHREACEEIDKLQAKLDQLGPILGEACNDIYRLKKERDAYRATHEQLLARVRGIAHDMDKLGRVSGSKWAAKFRDVCKALERVRWEGK